MMNKVKFGTINGDEFDPIEFYIMHHFHTGIEVVEEVSPYRERRFENLSLRKKGNGQIDFPLREFARNYFKKTDNDAYTFDKDGHVIQVDEEEHVTPKELRKIRDAVLRLKKEGWVDTKIIQYNTIRRHYPTSKRWSPKRDTLVIAQIDNWKIFNPKTMQYFVPK